MYRGPTTCTRGPPTCTGGPRKNATSTTTVRSYMQSCFNKTFVCIYKRIYKLRQDYTLYKNRNTFKLVRFEKFLVVFEVALFVGLPVHKEVMYFL